MNFLQKLGRKKYLNDILEENTQLGKVLNVVDLTAIGVGATLGVGIYVLPGVVAKDVAGPGVILSFFIAALTSVFAGLCFAEFGARVPRAGSAYTYSYVAIGEFVAFIIGWSLIIEYIIGSASVAKGLSVYVDSMLGRPMEGFYKTYLGLNNLPFLSDYVDLFAFVISLVVTVGLATGLKESMTMNNILTFINVAVVIFVIIAGSFKANIDNWRIPASDVPPGGGDGGFLPFGISGTIAGAATCFFGYVGFDCISASGEEVKNPQKAIPLAIISSLAIVFFAYFGISAVLTLMWPYYLQDPDAPLPYAFEQVGWTWAKWIVSIGGIFGLLASLIAGIFPLPRIIYAMANDGLLFQFLGKVHKKFQTPLNGTLVAGLITGLTASIFKLKQLVDLMSIFTLLVYTIVSACVLLLRYQESNDTYGPITHESVESSPLISQSKVTLCMYLKQIFNCRKIDVPSKLSSTIATIQTYLICLSSVAVSLMVIHYGANMLRLEILPIIGCATLTLLLCISLASIYFQPSSIDNLKFKVPLVPLIPVLSIFSNIYLMVLMDGETWIRFLIWLIGGLLIYFTYGIYHSTERRKTNMADYEILPSDAE